MKKARPYRLAIRALLIALVLVQSAVPFLGFIPLGVINITIVHLTVIVAAVVLGPNDGALLGLIWGLGIWFRSLAAPTSLLDTLVFINPVISVFPRILVGYLAGWVNRVIKEHFSWPPSIRLMLAAAVGSLLDTTVVLALMRLLAPGGLMRAYHVSADLLNQVLLTIVATNGLAELLLAVILVPMISLALLRANKFLDN
ncbi:ECF transporter S component [Lactobacillus sp. DCY120]|uniref:ECF transporter S component n=1 Tax=Bombilactobacillus apium TaxID=2675299 RepID=A0A850R0P9_9LACO|nr:ECF transporter S component [Bombilactobacillus apium]NVY96649.1 ECF transporter S component [Bombilactobacillus apium]